MSKFNIITEHELYPFKATLGDLFPKVCNDAKAFIGREEAKSIKSTLTGTSITDKCILVSKEGHKLALPLNNSMSVLIRFGMQLTKLDNAMGTRKIDKDGAVLEGLQSDLPTPCQSWIAEQRNQLKQPVVASK